MKFLAEQLSQFAKQLNCKTGVSGEYPPWEYKKDSSLQKLYLETYREQFGEEAEVVALHAGLECAVFSAGIKGLDCISIGPQLYDVHTVNERMSLSSTKNLLELQEIVTALLVESFNTKYMYVFKAKEITLKAKEEIPWTLDGEFGGQHDEVHIVNKKQALKIMVECEEEE